MRLDEITRDDFLQNLKDPRRQEAQKFIKRFLVGDGEAMGWKLESLSFSEEGDHWTARFHNPAALSMDDWIYRSVLDDTINALARVDGERAWDCRPNTQRTVEVYF